MGFKAGSDLGDNLFICTNFSDECEGDITIGDPQTCTIENVLVEQNFLDLAVTNFGSNNVSILLGNGQVHLVQQLTLQQELNQSLLQ